MKRFLNSVLAKAQRSGKVRPTHTRFARLCVEALETRTLPSVTATVGANVNISQLAGNQHESTIAINPTNPKNLFVAANDDTNGGNFVAFSLDGGVTWTGRQEGTATDGLPAGGGDTQTAFDQFGNLFLTYTVGASPNIAVVLSIDGGKTFTLLTQFAPSGRRSSILDQPSVATGAGSVWVSYTDNNKNIVAAGATVTGLGAADISTFTAQTVPGSLNGDYGNIAVGPNGQVLVTYQYGLAVTTRPDTIVVNLDANGVGGTFGAPVTVTTTQVHGNDSAITANSSNSGGTDAEANLAWDRSGGPQNGRVYLAYTDAPRATSPATKIFERFSDDNGATWSAAVPVFDAAANSNSEFLPSISVDQTTGIVGVAWYDSRNDLGKGGAGDTNNGSPNDDAQVFAAFSDDGGNTFSTNTQLSAGTSNSAASEPPPASGGRALGFGDFQTSDFFGGLFFRVWADNSNSTKDNPAGALKTMDVYTAAVSVTSKVTSPITVTGFQKPPVTPASPPGGPALPVVLAGHTYTVTVRQIDPNAIFANHNFHFFVSEDGGNPVEIFSGDNEEEAFNPENSSFLSPPPSLAAFDGQLYIAWTGTDSDNTVSVATLQLDSFGKPTGQETSKVAPGNHSSENEPALGVFDNGLFLAWDSHNEINSVILEFITFGGRFPGTVPVSEVDTRVGSNGGPLDFIVSNSQLFLGTQVLGAAPGAYFIVNLSTFPPSGVSLSGKSLAVTGDLVQANASDHIILDAAAGGVNVSVNGVTESFAPNAISSINITPLGGTNTIQVNALPPGVSLTIRSAGADFVTIGNGTLQGINGPVVVQGFQDVLSVDDRRNPNTNIISLHASTLDFNSTTSLISWTGINQFNFYGGGGDHTVNVLGTSSTATVNILTKGPATVNVGSNQLMSAIQGDLEIWGDYHSVALTLDDSKYRLGQDITLDSVGLSLDESKDGVGQGILPNSQASFESVTGMSPNSIIQFGRSDLSKLTLQTGYGDNTVFVNDTPDTGVNTDLDLNGREKNTVYVTGTTGKLNVNGRKGSNTITVFPAGNSQDSSYLGTIQGGVDVSNSSGSTTFLIVNDRNDALNHTAVLLDRARLSGLSAADITWQPGSRLFGVTSGVTSLSVQAGQGVNTYTVAATAVLPGGATYLNMRGTDTVNVENTAGPLNVNLGAGADTVNIGPTAQDLQTIQGAVTVTGGGGQGKLSVFDTNTTANYDYVLSGSSVSRRTRYRGGSVASAVITYSALTEVHVSGGTGQELYRVNDTAPGAVTFVTTNNKSGSQLGSQVVVTATTGALTVNTGGADTVTVGATVNLLDIIQSTVGSLDRIQAVVTVNGSGGTLQIDDQKGSGGFTLPAGATVTNQSLSYAIDNRQVTRQASVGYMTPFESGGITSLTTIACADIGKLELNGGNAGATYAVSATGAPAVVRGGSGNDLFQVTAPASSLGGPLTLDGQGGANTLDYSGYQGDVTVDLPLGTATGVTGGIHNIRNVTGGQGNNILVGNGGNVLTGGTGRNLLIAGPQASVLAGKTDEDILVGGSTAWDTNAAALAALMAEWTRTDLAYAGRVAHLLSGGGLNGWTRLNALDVTSNGGANTLTGAAGVDLFFGSLARDSYDWNASQGEVFVEDGKVRYAFALNATGAAPGNYSQGDAITTDSVGNVYVTGVYNGTVNFDPATGATNLSSTGQDDTFVAKYSSSGRLLWARSFGGTTSADSTVSTGITVDNAGNVFVTGHFFGTAVIGNVSFSSIGDPANWNAFAVKLDAAGNVLWTRQFAGSSTIGEAERLAVDGAGNLYVPGVFQGTMTFGSVTLQSAGDFDAFLVKLDSAGTVVWARRFGGSGYAFASSLALDGAGNVYVTGDFSGTATFGTFARTSAGGGDSYVTKLNSSGTVLWIQTLGGSLDELGIGIRVDSFGNVYADGDFQGRATFGSFSLTSAGGANNDNVYVAKLSSSNGTVQWADRLGGSLDSEAAALALDSAGNVYLTGNFAGTAAFGAISLTSAGDRDIFVAKLGSGGAVLWARRMGGPAEDVGLDLTVDRASNIYTTGFFTGTADLVSGPASYNLTATGDRSGYVSKLT